MKETKTLTSIIILMLFIATCSGCALVSKNGTVVSFDIDKRDLVHWEKAHVSHSLSTGQVILMIEREAKLYDEGEKITVDGLDYRRRRAEDNVRVEKAPWANKAVQLVLSSGHIIQAVTDQNGKAIFELPDRPDLLLPLKNLGVLTLPLKEKFEYEVPFTSEALAALPPKVKDAADALVEAVNSTRQRWEVARDIYLEKGEPVWQSYLAVKPTYEEYVITGEIKNWNDKELFLWGMTSWSSGGEGWAPEKTNIVVLDYDRNQAESTGFTQYLGQHYYLHKTSGKGYFGQSVPVRVYGPMPKEKGKVLAARRKWETASSKYLQPLEVAKAAYSEALAKYDKNLPTDPYGLKK